MYVRFEETLAEKQLASKGFETKWSARRTLLFLVISGVLCWSGFLLVVYMLVG